MPGQHVTCRGVTDDMSTIGHSEIRRRACAAFGVAAALSIFVLFEAGCGGEQQATEPEEPTRDEGLFGDPYEIVTNRFSAMPDDQPALSAETLQVNVAYTGGCDDHGFDLEFESDDDTTRVWLRHRNHGDRCEEDVFDRLDFELPEEALKPRTILLLNPNHEQPFVLRWGTPSPFDTMDSSQNDR